MGPEAMRPVFGHLASSGGGWLELVPPLGALALAVGMPRGGRRVAVYLAGAVMLAAVSPPVGDIAASGPAGHMVQHLLILIVVAPSVGIALSRGPHALTRRGRKALAALVWRKWSPMGAGLVHGLMVVAWHVPRLYDAALESAAVHALEHATMLSTGVWWWATIGHHARRRGLAPVMLSALGVSVAGAGLGVLMMFAPRAWYVHGDLFDQQLAGALMAGIMGAVMAAAAAMAVVWHLRRSEQVPVPARLGRAGVLMLALSGSCLVATPAVAEFEVPSGERLYQRDCASCHGPAGEGTRRGPSLAGAGEATQHYYLHTGRMPIADVETPIRRGPVPYTGDQLRELVVYASGLGDGPEMPSITGRGQVAAGGIHYRLHCASCHSATGAGGALAVEGFAPSLMPATHSDVLAAMAAGPGDMPSFAAVLDDRQMADVAAYVAHLQDPPGVGIAVPWGRVGEGIVAGGAIILLVAVIRGIGHSR